MDKNLAKIFTEHEDTKAQSFFYTAELSVFVRQIPMNKGKICVRFLKIFV